jgi:hypothetical protein
VPGTVVAILKLLTTEIVDLVLLGLEPIMLELQYVVSLLFCCLIEVSAQLSGAGGWGVRAGGAIKGVIKGRSGYASGATPTGDSRREQKDETSHCCDTLHEELLRYICSPCRRGLRDTVRVGAFVGTYAG